MNTPPDGLQSANASSRPEGALLRAVAEMDPAWVVLRDCALDQGAQARVRYALLHPDVGIALLDLLPGNTTPGAPDRLRGLLDTVGFRSAFGDIPPIVYLCVPSRSLFGLNGLLVREFDLQPPLALAGGDAWVGAVQGVLTAEPPLCVSGQTAAGTQPSFPILPAPQEGGTDRHAPRPNLGFRALAAFWGVVALAFGGGALVLQSLGPPDEPHTTIEHASGPGRERRESPQTTLGGAEAWGAQPDSDKMRLPSPNAILARWPAEPMPMRFDAARTGSGAPETGSLGMSGPRVDGDRSMPVAEATVPALAPGSSTSAAVGGTSIGRDRAGGAQASVAAALQRSAIIMEIAELSAEIAAGGPDAATSAPEMPFSDWRSPLPEEPRLAEGGHGSGGASEASTAGSGADAVASDAEALQWPADRTQDRVEPPDLADAPSLASPGTAEDVAGAVAPATSLGGGGVETANDRAAATADSPGEATLPAAEKAANSVSKPAGGPSAQQGATPGDPTAPTGTSTRAGAGVGPLPPAAAAAARAGWDGSAPEASGPEAPPQPSLGASPPEPAVEPPENAGVPSTEDAQGAAHADTRRTRSQEDPAGSSDAPSPQGAAEPEEVGGAAASADASIPAAPESVPSDGGAAPVVGARPTEPPVAAPGTPTPVPQTVAVPSAGVAEPAPSGATAPVARPAIREPSNKAAPVEETKRHSPAVVSMPPPLVEAFVTRGDAMVARRDISAARLLYERAAIAGNARAASALGKTYDPAFLAEIGAQGVRGDPALATAWYQKAVALGDSSALARMEALSGPGAVARERP